MTPRTKTPTPKAAYVCVKGFSHEPDGKAPQRFEVGEPVTLPAKVCEGLVKRGAVERVNG